MFEKFLKNATEKVVKIAKETATNDAQKTIERVIPVIGVAAVVGIFLSSICSSPRKSPNMIIYIYNNYYK